MERIKTMDVSKKRTSCEVYSRVVGYLRPVQQWNVGKQEEWKQRKSFRQDNCGC